MVTARQRAERGDANQGESYWWQDAFESRFGKTEWTMELDVHPAAGAAYRVTTTVKVPNKLFRMRDALKGRPTFSPGVAKLFPNDEPVVASLRQYVADLRATPESTPPAVPRPTPESHPPVEGVDYDQWVQAVLAVTRRMDPAALDAHYRSHGFPAGRGDAISATWYARVRTDPILNEWYLHDQATWRGQ